MKPISIIIFSVTVFAIHFSPIYAINIVPLFLDGLNVIGLGRPSSQNDQKHADTHENTDVPSKAEPLLVPTNDQSLSSDTLLPLLTGVFTDLLYSLVSDNRHSTADVISQYTLDFSGLVDPKKCKNCQVILYVSNSPKIGKEIVNFANGKSSVQQQSGHFHKHSLQDGQKENQFYTNDEQNRHQKINDKVSKHTEKIAGDLSVEIVKNFRQDLTNQINMLRIYHGVGVLKLDDQMSEIAQKRANSMANGRLLEKINESVFSISTNLLGKSLEEKLCKRAIDKWYEQGESVRYGEAQYDVAEAPDFTRLVWKSSENIGVGMAKNPTSHKYYVVVYYDYNGDYDKRLNDNVLSPWKERTKVGFKGIPLRKEPIIL